MSGSAIRRIGVLTSGGDGPGMNAAIRAVVRSAAVQRVETVGVLGGYDGLIQDHVRPLGSRDVSNIIQRGGTILRSARSEAFRTPDGRWRAVDTLRRHGIDALVAIGGDGTFTGAHILHHEHGTRIIGLPGTIDNDLSGTDATIGHDTALNTAVEAIDRIRDTASSHDRLFFVEVMGRDTGHIALQCAVAAGAEYVLIPEERQTIEGLLDALSNAPGERSSQIVVVAEGDEEGGAFEIARKVKERTSAYDIRVSVLGHLQRGGPPSVNDRILASRTGVAAVEQLLSGVHDAMVGVVNGAISITPFAEAIGRQRPVKRELLHVLKVLAS